MSAAPGSTSLGSSSSATEDAQDAGQGLSTRRVRRDRRRAHAPAQGLRNRRAALQDAGRRDRPRGAQGQAARLRRGEAAQDRRGRRLDAAGQAAAAHRQGRAILARRASATSPATTSPSTWCWRRLGLARAISRTPFPWHKGAPWPSKSPSRWTRSSASISGAIPTFALLLEAQWRGHDVFYYTPNNLSLRDGKLIAEGHSLTVEDKPGDHYRLAHPRSVDLAEYDVVHLRQDPPFDMAYITTTHLLGAHPARGRSWSTIRLRCATRRRRSSCSISSI